METQADTFLSHMSSCWGSGAGTCRLVASHNPVPASRTINATALFVFIGRDLS